MPRMFVTPQGKNLTLVRRLGQGQFGVADLVRDRRLENYCLKQVSVRTSDEEAKVEVLKEVELMKVSVHPNVVVLYDSWFDRNRLYILMEYCVNSSVDHLITEYSTKKIFFTEDKVVSFVTELSSALTFLHDKLRIMHRDLKPANIFMDRIGTLKIGDFGLSKCLGGDNLCATFVGTPMYMSPEQCKGDSYSFETDVWALGCITYEFMALKSPWIKGVSSYPALLKNITTKSPDFDILQDRYSDNLVNSVRWMLRKQTEFRWTAKKVNDNFRPQAVIPFVDVSIVMKEPVQKQAAPEANVEERIQAASIIQHSFRSRVSGTATQAKPIPPTPIKPTPITPIKPAPITRLKLDTRDASEVAVTRLQNGFRYSLNNRRRKPTTYRNLAPGPNAQGTQCSARIAQLAAPRRVQTPTNNMHLPRVPNTRPLPRAAWT